MLRVFNAQSVPFDNFSRFLAFLLKFFQIHRYFHFSIIQTSNYRIIIFLATSYAADRVQSDKYQWTATRKNEPCCQFVKRSLKYAYAAMQSHHNFHILLNRFIRIYRLPIRISCTHAQAHLSLHFRLTPHKYFESAQVQIICFRAVREGFGQPAFL